MKTTTLFSVRDLAKHLLKSDSVTVTDIATIGYVSMAIINIANWRIFCGKTIKITLDDIIWEILKMRISQKQKNVITRKLQTVENEAFICQWILPEFKPDESGFKNGNEKGASFTCKHCGALTCTASKNQKPHMDS
jgi:hypothetical protein